jgi:uncharacterized membrane protein YtjA (UPF0391 family)
VIGGKPKAGARVIAASSPQEGQMLQWTLIFLVVALVAGVLGFGGIASSAAGIAKILFVIFLVLFIGSLVLGRGWVT